MLGHIGDGWRLRLASGDAEVYRSEDLSFTWKRRTALPWPANESTVQTIWVSPLDPSLLFVPRGNSALWLHRDATDEAAPPAEK
ncbi:MAG: hypothetical protein ACKVVP_15295 [Chloroflexota bacterium]